MKNKLLNKIVNIEEVTKLYNAGILEDAEKGYLELISQNSKNADLYHSLGFLYIQLNQFDNAEKFLNQAIKLNNTKAEYWESLGVCFYMQQDYENAMLCFDNVLQKKPKDLQRIRDFAKLASQAKQYQYAIKFYSKSVSIDKRDKVALNNIGLLYEDLQEYDKAKIYYERSLKIAPTYFALHNLGVWYRRNREFSKSVTYLKRALSFQPDNVETKTSLGMSYLSMKDFENGYKYYKERCPQVRKNFMSPWDGKTPHKQDTIFVYYDGGRGDQLMFCRYMTFLKDKFKKVIWAVYPELQSFFQENYPDFEVCRINDNYKYNFSIDVMELHYYMGMDFNNIPYSKGYLKANDEKINKYRKYFEFDEDKLKVGLFWQGNTNVFPYRSMKLDELSNIFDLENCKFYSFQKGAGIEQLNSYRNIPDLGSTFEDYSDTAGAIKNLDILITVDTSILHLAGALGVKTFLMLPYASEWRWFDCQKQTPWYDSVTIFKQKKLFDWSFPVAELYENLKNNIKTNK